MIDHEPGLRRLLIKNTLESGGGLDKLAQKDLYVDGELYFGKCFATVLE